MVKYDKAADGSYIHNCYVEARESTQPCCSFYSDNEKTTVCLNGYAVIPLEKYAELTGKDMSNMLENVAIANKQLHGS